MATILIVDDEVDCRRPLATLLKCEGYEVHEAGNGLEGMEALNRRDYDMVLLDLAMPVMDGVQMLQGIRKQAKWANLPVFLVTAQHETQLLRNARAIGIQEYIFKGDTPFMKMLELIKRHLGEAFTPRRRGRKPKPRPEVVQPDPAKMQVGSFYAPAPGMYRRPVTTTTSTAPVAAATPSTPGRSHHGSRCPDRGPNQRPAGGGSRKYSSVQLEYIRRND
jgi:two-component system chemotaxis response regulator CheY